jgi:hypothetical protein
MIDVSPGWLHPEPPLNRIPDVNAELYNDI